MGNAQRCLPTLGRHYPGMQRVSGSELICVRLESFRIFLGDSECIPGYYPLTRHGDKWDGSGQAFLKARHTNAGPCVLIAAHLQEDGRKSRDRRQWRAMALRFIAPVTCQASFTHFQETNLLPRTPKLIQYHSCFSNRKLNLRKGKRHACNSQLICQ